MLPASRLWAVSSRPSGDRSSQMVACMNSRNPKCQAVLHSGLPGKLCRRPARPGRRAGPTATTHRQTIDCSTIPRKRFCTCAQAANDSESSCERTWVSARSSSASIEVMPSFWQRRLNANSVPAVALDPPPPPGRLGLLLSLLCARLLDLCKDHFLDCFASRRLSSGVRHAKWAARPCGRAARAHCRRAGPAL